MFIYALIFKVNVAILILQRYKQSEYCIPKKSDPVNHFHLQFQYNQWRKISNYFHQKRFDSAVTQFIKPRL